ncbi:MAG: type II toxin-antitoxin system PemK/MazF family toxin [Nitrospinota bacterium]
MVVKIKRGDIFWVSFDPSRGSETKKCRPALIISNDIANQHSKRVTVVPITSNVSKIYPFEVRLNTLKKPGKAMADQLRSIDKARLEKKIGQANSNELQALNHAVKLHLNLI